MLLLLNYTTTPCFLLSFTFSYYFYFISTSFSTKNSIFILYIVLLSVYIKIRDRTDISQLIPANKPNLQKSKKTLQTVSGSFCPQQFLPTGIQKLASA